MRYVRPNFKMGGTPSGIESLTPRVQAQDGFFANRPLFLLPNNLANLQNQRFNVGISGGQTPYIERMMKSFPLNVNDMGVASVAKAKKPLSSTQKLDQEMNEIIGMSGYGEIESGPKTDLTKVPDFILQMMGTAETRAELNKRKENEKLKLEDDFETEGRAAKVLPGETALDAVLREGKVISEKRAKETGEGDEGDVDPSKDTQPGGDVKEDSFETEYDKQYKRVEKYLGKDVDKGEIAIALSDAIGTPGTLADKAAVLNKFLLRKSAGMKKDKRDMAKLAYAATVDLEKAQIAAGKKSQTEKLIDRARVLSAKKERTTDEDLELKLTRSALGDNKKLANLNQVLAAGKDVRKDITNYKEQLSVIEKLEGGAKEQAQNTANSTKQDILSTIQILKSYGVDDATLRGLFGDDLKLFLAEGGRVEMAMGGATEASANPIDTKLTFEQLRTRLPKEITDDIVRLVANSEEALQDFAYIRTQGDVEKFNVKYGVNLVLPQNTA